MTRHPKTARLVDFALGIPRASERKALAEHLAHCTRCRHTVSGARDWFRDGSAAPARAPRPLRSRIIAAVDQRLHVVLPTADPRPLPAHRRLLWPAAAVALLAFGAATILRVSDAGAEASQLSFSVPDLRSGQDVTATYLRTGMFAGADSLMLRARFRTPADQPYESVSHATVAVLYPREGRTFKGSFRIPVDAVYAVFAVEDPGGRVIDTNRQQFWDLLETADGTPSYASLLQKQNDLLGRSWRSLFETVRLKAELYPNHPMAWNDLLAVEQLVFGTPLPNSTLTEYGRRLDRLDRRWKGEDDVPGDVTGGMYLLARSLRGLRAPTTYRWRARLLEEAPGHPAALQERIAAIGVEGSADQHVAALEMLRSELGADVQIDRAGYYMALQAGQWNDLLTWGNRLAASSPPERVQIATQLSTIPHLRDVGIRGLRQAIQQIDVTALNNRPLDRTVAMHRTRARDRRRDVLSALGAALVSDGQVEAGLMALDVAIMDTWNPRIFQAVARARFAVQDTAGALEAMANAAVDPNTRPPTRDSLHGTAVAILGEALWDERLRAAEHRMYDHVAQKMTHVALPRGLRILDDQGEWQTWPSVIRNAVTVVTSWSPYDGQWVAQMARLRSTFRQEDVGILAIGAEGLEAVIPARRAARDRNIPTYYDENGRLREALNWWANPNFYVVDGSGFVRFSTTSFESVMRQVVTLAATQRSESIIADSDPD